MSIEPSLHQLIQQSLALKLIEKEDEVYARNRVLALLGLDEYHLEDGTKHLTEEEDPLEAILDFAYKKGLIDESLDERDQFANQIMDCFVARPSIINQEFYKKYDQNPKEATHYFYELSQNSRYIKMKDIRKNINYQVSTDYGELDITINLSKPEKDPKAISRAKSVKSSSYPKCLLCIENEGFLGRIGHPARSNHRMIRVDLLDEQWFLQYSPYVYYNEHCILLSEEHRDMRIDQQTFQRLLAFVGQFPHYFIGSNADLPIVGGSILSHEHYQGGNYEFAMAKAQDDYGFTLKGYPTLQASIINWPMPVIRFRGTDISPLVKAANDILIKWKGYSDPSVEIFAFTDNTPHNTITPIARKREDVYELDLVLRNNRTSDEHPLGIFHPHADVHHIKKENIGLIEVMGLAVLPARLQRELLEVENYLLEKPHDMMGYHEPWAHSLKETYKTKLNKENVSQIIKREVGLKFLRVLEDAAVFKRNEQGQDALKRFINEINGEMET
jgi:UDPglucose--hexose-1-phosphate uridylyltransferase